MHPLMMALKTGSVFMEIILRICKNDEKEFSLSKEREKKDLHKNLLKPFVYYSSMI